MHSTHQEVDLRLRVSRHELIADDVAAVELQDPKGGDLPWWAPGAHIDVRLCTGLVRQYSLCGDPADRGTWRIAVLRTATSRGGSQYVHDKLRPGDLVDVRGPRNHFPLAPSPRYVFIAGGIGITPLLPMLEAAEAASAAWELHYGGRTRSSMAFSRELTDRHPDRVVVRPLDELGRLDLDAVLGSPRSDTLVYCCGPETLMQAVEDRCRSWPSQALHLERFAQVQQLSPTSVPRAFEVELVRSRMTLSVPEDASLLEVLDAAGVSVLSSCREGLCGTCEVPVLAGRADHRDSLLTEDERAAGATMFPCVSRAAGPRLVLDL